MIIGGHWLHTILETSEPGNCNDLWADNPFYRLWVKIDHVWSLWVYFWTFSSLVTHNGVLVQKIRVHGHKPNKFIWLTQLDSNFITCPFSFFLWQNLSIVQQSKKFTSSLPLVWHQWSKEVGVKVGLSSLLLLITGQINLKFLIFQSSIYLTWFVDYPHLTRTGIKVNFISFIKGSLVTINIFNQHCNSY